MENNNQKLIAQLEELLQFCRDNPTFPEMAFSWISLTVPDKAVYAEALRMMGKAEKFPWDNQFAMIRRFRTEGVEHYAMIYMWINREQVCRKKLVGTKIHPAKPAHEVPASEERVEEIFEWDCGDPILAAVRADQNQIANAEAIMDNPQAGEAAD